MIASLMQDWSHHVLYLLGNKFGETLIESYIFSFKKMHFRQDIGGYFVSASMC